MAETLDHIAQKLKAGRPSPSVRVREFLAWFDAYRRGFNIVERIRATLSDAGLRTIPDFEEPHIDAEIVFALIPESQLPVEPGASNKPFRAYSSDPIWRVRRLRPADRSVVTVSPNDTLKTAITKMLVHDFSQLPVISGRDVKGAITWASIGTKLAFGIQGGEVRHFMVSTHIIQSNTPLLKAIPQIIEHEYVLVLSPERKITGIITTTDISEEFREQTEPFLILREIEHQIRQLLIEVAHTPEEVLVDASLVQATNIHDLSFGDYVRIVEQRDWWSRLDIPIDRSEFVGNLNRVREIRNKFMHFDPDTFERDVSAGRENPDVEFLRHMNTFFQTMLSLVASARAEARSS